MKITRITGSGGYETKIAMACIVSSLERQGRAVLICSGDSTTRGILMTCSSPVPFAIVLHDFNPRMVDLEELCSEPRLQNVLCYVEQSTALTVVPDDPLDDVLPLPAIGDVPRLVRASDGIVALVDDSEGGHHD